MCLASMTPPRVGSITDAHATAQGRYPVLVAGVVRVETIEEAKELLEDVA